MSSEDLTLSDVPESCTLPLSLLSDVSPAALSVEESFGEDTSMEDFSMEESSNESSVCSDVLSSETVAVSAPRTDIEAKEDVKVTAARIPDNTYAVHFLQLLIMFTSHLLLAPPAAFRQ